MTGATLFSGILCPEVAMPWVDWKFCAEVDPFPCSVIKHRAPNLPNLGDVTAKDFIDKAKQYGPIDLLVGGSPCQAFSVAGLRKSLQDDRGNLTLRYVEIANAINPQFVLWENVPGVLNTEDNAFGCFLAGLVGADAPLVPTEQCGGRWTNAGVVTGPFRTAAWCVRDAQHFGVPQRRRRVFVLAGRTGEWPHPGAVLFIAQGMRGDSAKSKEARQAVAALTSNGVGTCGAADNQAQAGHLICEEIAATLKGGSGERGWSCDDGAPLVFQKVFNNTGQGWWSENEVSQAVRSGNRNGGGEARNGTLIASTGNVSHCLNAGGMHRIDYETETLLIHSLGEGFEAAVMQNLLVRRLLPIETERLQGLPDDWTLVPYHGKLAADGPRYKAIGNGMAVPVMREIGECLRQCVDVVELRKKEDAA